MSTQGSSDRTFYIRRIWRLVLWAALILAAGYIGIVIYAYPQDAQRHASEKMVAQINAARITEADVDGSRLPPAPSSNQIDTTVVGIDANDNGIRDDVELAIFAKYATSTAIRSAELQYALDQQMYLTDVFDQATWQAVAHQDARGYACIAQTVPRDDLSLNVQMTNQRAQEVEDLVFNTAMRQHQLVIANQYETSFEVYDPQPCDIDPQLGQ